MGPLTNNTAPPMRHLSKALLALLFAALPVLAQDEDVESQASLVVDHQSIAPGSTFTAALHLYHPEGWHSYYRNTGGIELPPNITWTLPEGFKAGAIQWPTPKIKEGYFGTSFIYEGSLTLLVDITAPAKLEVGSTATLKADASWQICQDTCLDEKKQFELQLPVAESAVLDSASEEMFKQARAKLPAPEKNWSYSAANLADLLGGLLRYSHSKHRLR